MRRWRWSLAGTLAAVTFGAVPIAVAAAASVGTDRDVRVAVVMDFGSQVPRANEVVIRCVRVPPGSNGTDVLAYVLDSSRVPTPTYNDSGLLCSIDGLPRSGCGAPSGGGFAYWSYWHGGTSWSYASVGPAEWTVHDEDVEGWRFDADSTGSGSDQPPAAPSRYAAACAAATVASFPVTTAAPGPSVPTVAAASAAGLLAIGLFVASARRWRRQVSRS